jgi:tetratricopeptide (TPR) repeat protein
VARKDTVRYRASKFVQRNRIAVAAAIVVLLSLIAGIIATAWEARIATAERDRARRQAAKAERVTTFLQNVLGFSDPGWASSNPKRNRDATVSEAMAEAARRAETELSNEPEALAAVHFTLGSTYRVQGLYREAEPHLRAALDIRQRLLGSNNKETAQSMVALAEWFFATSHYPEAEPLLRDSVPVFRDARDLKWLAIALTDLGTLKSTTGDYGAAEKLFKEGLEISTGLTGADRVLRTFMFTGIGGARAQQGDLLQAVEFLEKSIEEHRVLPGDPRAELAYALHTLGSIRFVLGELERAEALLSEAHELYKKTVGESHLACGSVLAVLADVHYHRAEYEKARHEIERALQIQSVLPPDQLDLTRSRLVSAKIEMRTGAPEKAESELRAIIEALVKSTSKEHPLVASARGALGECLILQKRYADAEPVLLESHRVFLARMGPGDPRTRAAAARLVTLYEEWEKPAQAHLYRAAP